jgi:hypothetical protein
MGRSESVTVKTLNLFKFLGEIGGWEQEVFRDDPLLPLCPIWVDLLLGEQHQPAEGQLGVLPCFVRK